MESRVVQGIAATACGVALALPIRYFGIWWPVLIIVAGLSFALGWNMARRKLLRDGYIPGI
ncbi:hypothetical protein [Coralloluteibacterium thermophilus]|uniref:Phosphatidate cytidylyltransferase n=1 Tax=Coralloluteibacterium thermophilum TaxID=2707049 RepID=A0ABV9NL57_9GAMM